MNDPYDHTPYLHPFRRHGDRRIGGVGRQEMWGTVVSAQAFHSEAAIDEGHDDIAHLRLYRLVDDQEVAILQPEAYHRVTLAPGVEGGLFVRQQVIEVQVFLEEVCSWRWKARTDAALDEGDADWLAKGGSEEEESAGHGAAVYCCTFVQYATFAG